MSDIFHRLPTLAAGARNFVSQLDAPTLHDRLNKMANACDEAHVEIARLRALGDADVRKDAPYAEMYIRVGNIKYRLHFTESINQSKMMARGRMKAEASATIDQVYEAIDAALNHQT